MKTKDNRKETNAQAWFSIPSCEAAEMQVRKKSSGANPNTLAAYLSSSFVVCQEKMCYRSAVRMASC